MMIAYLRHHYWNQLYARETVDIALKISHTELRLQVEDLINTETITGLLEKTQISALLEGCQCGNVGTSRSADLVTQTFEIMIFHLNYNEYNAINKIIPNLNIQKE